MTLNEAKVRAKVESKTHACVQHVNLVEAGPHVRGAVMNEYQVSDWYDCDTTVASYENGKEL